MNQNLATGWLATCIPCLLALGLREGDAKFIIVQTDCLQLIDFNSSHKGYMIDFLLTGVDQEGGTLYIDRYQTRDSITGLFILSDWKRVAELFQRANPIHSLILQYSAPLIQPTILLLLLRQYEMTSNKYTFRQAKTAVNAVLCMFFNILSTMLKHRK